MTGVGFGRLLRRDLLLVLRQGGDALLTLAFYLLAVAIFPFGVGPEPQLLARIVASGAPLWLLDEPTNALDDEAEAMFAAALAAHRAQGGMAVIALHGGEAPPQAELLAFQPAIADAFDEEGLIEA